ncbi:MAG: TonB-dependent receptor [Acidobacteriota bacterium]
MTTSFALFAVMLAFPLMAETSGATADAPKEPPTTKTIAPDPSKPVDPDHPSVDDQKTVTAATPSFFAETTVTATGSKRDVFEVATPVTVIRHDEIQRKVPQNAAELLRYQPGTDVADVGPNQMRPIIRAQRGLRVLFLENGLRMNNARRQTDFGEISGLVDIDSVETIEVVRGPASVLYGSDAIGGVLNLVSREPSSGDHLRGFLDLSYASAGERRRAGASISGSAGKFLYQLGGSTREADDYVAPAGTFGDIRLSRNSRVLDTGVADSSIWGSFGYAITDRNTLRLRVNHYDARDAGFGYLPGDRYGVDEQVKIRILYPSQKFDRYSLSYTGNYDRSLLASSANVQLYYQKNDRVLVNDININIGPIGPSFPNSFVKVDTRNVTGIETTGFRVDAVKPLFDGRHTLTYGVEGFRDRISNTDFSDTVAHLIFPGPPFEVMQEQISNVANSPNATNSSSGVFLQDEMTLASRLRLTAGLRYQRVETKAEPTPQLDITGLDFSDSNTVGALMATYQITDSLNALVSYGTAFRAPNVIERLFNGPTPEGNGFQILNPGLSSEKSSNWDLGVKYRGRNAFLELVGFRNVIRQGIIQDFLSPSEIGQLPADIQSKIAASGAQFVVQQVNADRLRYQGVELAVGYHVTPVGLTVGGNYTHINATRLGSTTILPPDDVYSDKAFAYARYQQPGSRFWTEYDVRHNGSAKANIDPDQPVPPVGRTLPSFTIHSLGVGARVWESSGMTHDLTVWGENLTNELYAEFSNASFFRPEPGRRIRVAYRLSF